MEKETLAHLKDNISDTFCMAKFHEATIWLYSSKIASCHHTPLFPTGDSVVTFYNNKEKRKQQNTMLLGEKPQECNYCWKLEDQGITSDREHKSLAFKSFLEPRQYLDRNFDFKPKALELAFQNTCNLACAYCSPSFSTEWINDIKQHGSYRDIKTDVKQHYSRGIDNNIPADPDLFWKWFDSVAEELESIRITGGEPLLHEETFHTFNKMIEKNPNVECVIHTNLCQKPRVIDRFINAINKLPNVRINVSNESAGSVAEFIRDGMVYEEWLRNVERLINETSAMVSISTTITALSLISLNELYDDIIKIRKKSNSNRPYISVNFATYPEFQSLNCLSKEEREFYQKKYRNFFFSTKSDLLDQEKNYIDRIITMLDPNLVDSRYKEYRTDSDNFFSQYTVRRKKDFNFSSLIGRK
jgi:MoaA/NifB/PqqE/SkfB family radical SAM enzyme